MPLLKGQSAANEGDGPCRADQRRLAQAYAAVFDRSRLEAALTRLCAGDLRDAELVGEGTCFVVWRLLWRDRPELNLVLKRAKPEWRRAQGAMEKGWRRALNVLSEARPLLLSPFDWVETAGGELGLVMPYGEAMLSKAAPHWQPLADRTAVFEADLKKVGLTLGDQFQGRCWSGVPFVADLSDVRLF